MTYLGVDPRTMVHSLRATPGYLRGLRELKKQSGDGDFAIGPLRPCLGEASSESGLASGHYFHQDLLVARRVFENAPARHVDVGSRIDGFVAHIATFRTIEVLDIRPMSSTIKNVEFIQGDVMAALRPDLVDRCDSLSCLHALEHFGLGRYGDPIAYDGHLRGLGNLHRLLRSGGKLYLSVPIGPQRIEFNAHRVFSVDYLLELLDEDYRTDSFSYVDDQGDLHEDVQLNEANARESFGCYYGLGIFELTKL